MPLFIKLETCTCVMSDEFPSVSYYISCWRNNDRDLYCPSGRMSAYLYPILPGCNCRPSANYPENSPVQIFTRRSLLSYLQRVCGGFMQKPTCAQKVHGVIWGLLPSWVSRMLLILILLKLLTQKQTNLFDQWQQFIQKNIFNNIWHISKLTWRILHNGN